MNLTVKRIQELFGYARTLAAEQGVGVMAARAAGFFKRRFFAKGDRYLPSKQVLAAQRAADKNSTAPMPCPRNSCETCRLDKSRYCPRLPNGPASTETKPFKIPF